MQDMDRCKAEGFSLVELVIAMAVGLIVMAGAVSLFRSEMNAMHTLAQRAEMQQNVRVAVNLIARDLSLAGTGVASGGIPLPSGAGATQARFACDQTGCYLAANVYTANRLYAITPGHLLGPVINGQATDTVTLVYDDPNFDLSQFQLDDATPTGDQIEINPATVPPITDPAVGIQVGDVISVCNTNGCAAGTVTNVPSNELISFAAADPLRFNQPGAAVGKIASILVPPPTGAEPYNPDTRAKRILVVTYYIQIPPGPDASPRLMRQVNAHPPVPVADNVESLQITYDIFNENTGVATANLADAGGLPNQIRKATITVSCRSPLRRLASKEFDRIALTTSATPRNLSFRDRYQ